MEGDITDKPGDVITITGDFTQEIQKGKIYTFLLKEITHPTYGRQYQLVYLHREVDLSKLRNMKAFLEVFLTTQQVNNLLMIYPEPLEILKEHNIEALLKVPNIGPSRAAQIIARFEEYKDQSEIYSELASYGFTPNFVSKLLSTYKNSQTIIDVVTNHPYQLYYDIKGVGFIKADEIALSGGIDPKSFERLKAFICYTLEKCCEEDGDSYITAGEMLHYIYNFFGGEDNILEYCHDDFTNTIETNISKAFRELCENGTIIIEDNENKSKRRIYLKRIYELEEQIAQNLIRLMNGHSSLDYSGWKEKVIELEQRQGFSFDFSQREGILTGLQNQVCFITGLAGSGKSSLVSGILASLPKASFAQCALSGKAAARLQEVTGQEGTTIHRLLQYKDGYFTKNKEDPLIYDIIIVDEISLIGGEIFLKLLEAIPSGTKLIMLGDLGQLEAIGALNLAADLFKSEQIPTIELTTIHRQAAKSGIITSAHRVRNNYQLFDGGYTGVSVVGEKKDMILDIRANRENIVGDMIKWFDYWYNHPLCNQDISQIQLISPVRERGDNSVYNLNIAVQEYLKDKTIEEGPSFTTAGKYSYEIFKGDKVMCIKNNYHTMDIYGGECAIYNGWIGTVTSIDEAHGKMIINFPLLPYDIILTHEQMRDSIVLGYASTVHKLQGSSASIVLGVIDYSTPPGMLTCQLVYTLLTRAKDRCILVAQNGALSKAIATDKVSTKRTFLQELLEKF